MLLRGTSVRVGVAEPGEYAAFQPLHAPRIALVFVVKALQMQHAVDHQVRVMRVTADTARARPDTQPGAWRQLSGPDAILDRQRELRRPARLASWCAARRH